MHIVALETLKLAVYPSRAPLLGTLQQDRAHTKIFPEYINYANVVFPNLAIDLIENTTIKKHVIELVDRK